MLRPALLLSALLLTLGVPVTGATVADVPTDPVVEVRECHSHYDSFQLYVNGEPASDCFVFCCEEAAASGPVEVRECHSGYQSFQVYVNGEPVTRCFVLCCEAAEAGTDGPEVRPCPGGYYVIWDPLFETRCIPVPLGGPEVQSCGGGSYRIVWDPFFETTCFP